MKTPEILVTYYLDVKDKHCSTFSRRDLARQFMRKLRKNQIKYEWRNV